MIKENENKKNSKNFALIGAAGFVAARHMKAIKDTGNNLIAAVDKNDSVGILDNFFPNAKFFTEIERFDRFIEKLRRSNPSERIEYISICTPNYLHDAHVRLALRVKADAICEKPLVINPWNLDALLDLEVETGQRVYTIFQLRYHSSLLALKKELETQQHRKHSEVVLTYITRRGPWYNFSWKGSIEKSGGIAMNIGVHFFDLLIWLFGEVNSSQVHLSQTNKMAGKLEMDWATVHWFLSSDEEDLPREVRQKGGYAYRSLTMDGNEIEFSGGFTDLHTTVYREILQGNGLGIEEARPSIELVYKVRTSDKTSFSKDIHPFLLK